MSKLRWTVSYPLPYMQKLLTASLLLASCALLHPAIAQRTPLTNAQPYKATQAQPNHSAPTTVPNWVSTEFSQAYGRYFPALPNLYKYSAGQALRDTPLAQADVDLSSTLAESVTLREAVYQTIYQYCYNVKHGSDTGRPVDELVYLLLYHDLHLNATAATGLTLHITSRYKRPAPVTQSAAKDGDVALTDEPTPDQVEKGAIYAYMNSVRPSSSAGLGPEVSGWHLDNTPVVEALDDKPGVIRFKIKINDDGEVEDINKVSGDVSPAQEKLCRDKLLDATFIKTNPSAGAATGFYTFRFSVK
jgi:hypothetical protein